MSRVLPVDKNPSSSPSPKAWQGEVCQRCKRPYAVVWAAEDDLWNEIVGSSAGMLCPDCFDDECNARGIFPFFVAFREHVIVRTHAGLHQRVRDLEAHIERLHTKLRDHRPTDYDSLKGEVKKQAAQMRNLERRARPHLDGRCREAFRKVNEKTDLLLEALGRERGIPILEQYNREHDETNEEEP